MTDLVMAIYAEGRADETFLPIIVQRGAEQILAQRGRTVVDVLEPIVLNHSIDRAFPTRAERILEAARRAAGYHALVVHADADHPTRERALQERFMPGLERVCQAQQALERVCDKLVPMIPVQMTEAWMLADPEALRAVVGTRASVGDLGLPAHAREVESDPDPQRTLAEAVRNALAPRPRRRRIVTGDIFEPLARQINLERLGTVPAYQQFASDLTDTLIALHLAE